MADIPNIVLTDPIKDQLADIDGAIDVLNNHHFDSGFPKNPVTGQIVYVNSKWWWYDGSSWLNAGVSQTLQADLDLNGKQLKTAIIEKLVTGSLPTPGSGTEARISFDSTLKRFVLTTAAGNYYLGQLEKGGATKILIATDLSVDGLATPATADTTGGLPGWLLNTAAERLNVLARAPIPTGYTNVPAVGKDMQLLVEVLLKNGETANDLADMGGLWEALSDGAVPGADQVTFAAIQHDIQTGNAQYTRHLLTLALDYDAPSANAAAGDTLMAEIHHNVAGQVSGLIVTRAWFSVPVLNFGA